MRAATLPPHHFAAGCTPADRSATSILSFALMGQDLSEFVE
jgi:hypothetical protein